MVSIFLPILQFLQFSFPNSWGPSKQQLEPPSPSCLTAFTAFWQVSSIWLSFRFLLIPLCGPREQQNPLPDIFFFTCLKPDLSLNFWHEFCLYFKVPENLMGLIFLDGVWFMYKPILLIIIVYVQYSLILN